MEFAIFKASEEITYLVDPLTCPKCQGRMRIISFIEDEEVIEKLFKHLGLWDLKVRPPPKVKAPSVTISINDSDSQVPFSAPSFHPDPDYPILIGFQNRTE